MNTTQPAIDALNEAGRALSQLTAECPRLDMAYDLILEAIDEIEAGQKEGAPC